MTWRVRETHLAHYGIKGMKWRVRRTAEELGHKIVRSKPGQFAKRTLYQTFDVDSVDELIEKGKAMLKTPKGIAMLAAIVLLPDPLIWTGTAAYTSLKTSGALNFLVHSDEEVYFWQKRAPLQQPI